MIVRVGLRDRLRGWALDKTFAICWAKGHHTAVWIAANPIGGGRV